jgi:thioesterase domain-containing protein
MLPGAGGGPAQYVGLASSLAEHYEIFAARAAGLMPGERPETSIAEMAEAALAAVDEADLKPNLVLGWSMGGVIAWELCVRLSERGLTPALVLVDSSPLPQCWPPTAQAAVRDRILAMLGKNPDEPSLARVEAVLAAHLAALAEYRAQRSYPGRTLALMCVDDPYQERLASLARWRELAPNLIEGSLSGGHFEALEPGRLGELTEQLTDFTAGPARAAR